MKNSVVLLLIAQLLAISFSQRPNAQSLVDTPLYLTWVGVIDNGEGDGWPHGPHGNLHVTLSDVNGDEIEEFVIEGPSDGEFLDGDEANYRILIGYIGLISRGVGLQIWESDPGPGRDDDVLFSGWINNFGIWNSAYAAPHDAVKNARRRGANSWAKKVWNGGVRVGIPKMFVEISSY